MTDLMRPALVTFATLSLLTGLGYPALVTALGQAIFPAEANGSLIRDGERVIGSTQIGQAHSDPRFFWSRPSATGPVAFNAAASTGSNLGPSNPALHDAVKGRIEALRAAGAPPGPVPADLVTTSGSGLDPHISPAAAHYQAARVAQARGLSEDAVRRLIDARIEDRSFGLLGEPRVNVLLLNLDLERNEGTSGGE
jgi:K+-transporting ATPase ATPase C chain